MEFHEEAYDIDNKHSAKEKGASVHFLGFTAGCDETTIYDSTGQYYEEVDNETKGEVGYTVGASAALGVGVDLKVNLEEFLEFVVELFK